MHIAVRTYRQLAVILWGVVSGVAGWSGGYYLGWGQRKLVFAVVVMVGIYGLFILGRVSKRKEDVVSEREAMASDRMWSSDSNEKVTDQVGQLAGNKEMKKGQNIDEERARKKLDDFLLMQQDK